MTKNGLPKPPKLGGGAFRKGGNKGAGIGRNLPECAGICRDRASAELEMTSHGAKNDQKENRFSANRQIAQIGWAKKRGTLFRGAPHYGNLRIYGVGK